jgi:hypothetical protein
MHDPRAGVVARVHQMVEVMRASISSAMAASSSVISVSISST